MSKPAPGSVEDDSQRGGRVLTHLGVMAAVATVIGVLAAGLALPFAAVLGAASEDVSKGIDELPAELEAKPLAQRTSVYDADGNLIASLFDENRITVGLDQISRKMVEAIVAIEDYRYFEHGALDLKGTLRALITNQASSGVVQGGSSITQQMVKLTLVDQAEDEEEAEAATDETYARKFKELRYAIAFEQNYSKEWILERYLNIAYFGDGAYGIQSAAKHFFNKNAKQLNLKQAATLAGLVKNPTGYDPTNYPERALARRNVVLDRMAELNVIDDEKAEKLKGQKLGLKVKKQSNGCVNSPAPFYCDYVIKYLLEDRSLGKTKKDRERLLWSGGLTIRTTLDLDFQKAADDSVRSHVYPTDDAIGGLAMIEPRTGNVKALAQSRPMGSNKKAGQTYLNYVVPEEYGDSRGFQAGSTFKPFVLAAALKQGEISMTQTFNSPESMTFRREDFIDCDGAPYDYGEWTVGNSTTSGAKNMYTGTRESVNTYYVQLIRETGICEPFNLAKKMGVRLTNPEGDANGFGAERVASFVLGIPSTSPLEMAEAYATFAGRGLHCDARPVTAIEDAQGNLLKEYPQQCEQVLPGAVADAVNDVLRGVVEPGGFGAALTPGQPAAGKTGTINSNMAVWFVGYTPNMAAAAMIAGANDVGHWVTLNGQVVGGSYIGSASGSSDAGPIWGDAMRTVAPELADEDFQRPDSTQIVGVLTPVPDVVGQSMADAEANLRAAGFNPVQGDYVNSELPAGTVAATSPAPGAQLSGGDTVVMNPSTGYVPEPPRRKGKGKGRKGRGRG
ncbi:transglycosylase domain-containing protein [Nocardioides solisilvae]|uniref:transglycosylase domain-containing protein n=1 Tax=Nocardioides solisilvae TaxID=1542435 RepID=UPI0013A5779D|nr:transglycosylase domain-containing protein [Nocardioides solisilvae]